MKHYLLSTSGQNELVHYGVIGMKWGVRRYQNKDGSLTEAGKKKYGEGGEHRYTSMETKIYNKAAKKAREKGLDSRGVEYAEKQAKRSQEIDDRMLEYSKRVSAGGNIATRLLTGGLVGGRPYQQILSVMNGQNDYGFTGKKLAASVLSAIPYSAIIARTLYTSGYINN